MCLRTRGEAPAISGLYAKAAYDILDTEIRRTLNALSKDYGKQGAELPESAAADPDDLDSLSPDALATLSNELKARAVELKHAVGRGEFIPIEEWVSA